MELKPKPIKKMIEREVKYETAVKRWLEVECDTVDGRVSRLLERVEPDIVFAGDLYIEYYEVGGARIDSVIRIGGESMYVGHFANLLVDMMREDVVEVREENRETDLLQLDVRI